ncbi:hypothetical protein Hdeb2414_s0001g00037141 [Helianthus debilis subsp. tardiflorus]
MAAINLRSMAAPISLPHPKPPPNSTRSLSLYTPQFSLSTHTKTLQLHPSKPTKHYTNLLHLAAENNSSDNAATTAAMAATSRSV